MEKRILLAFTLSFIVFVVYMRMFAPQPEDIPVQYPDSDQVTETTPQERPLIKLPNYWSLIIPEAPLSVNWHKKVIIRPFLFLEPGYRLIV